jgi:hypothetical protein
MQTQQPTTVTTAALTDGRVIGTVIPTDQDVTRNGTQIVKEPKLGDTRTILSRYGWDEHIDRQTIRVLYTRSR